MGDETVAVVITPESCDPVSCVSIQGLRLCEQHAQKCLVILVEALCAAKSTPVLATDAAWILNHLTLHCDVTRQWMLDVGGIAAVRSALVAKPMHDNLVNCAVGIVYNLEGLPGLGFLLANMSAEGSFLPDTVLSVIVWATT